MSEFAPGSTTATATLSGLNYPYALAFDASGNLFVANLGGTTVSEFAPGSTTATATLSGLPSPIALAFDASGNLFVANEGGTTVSEFTAASFTPRSGGVVVRPARSSEPMSLGGSSTPASTLSLTNAELAQIFTTASGTVTIGDPTQTGTITFHSATLATTAGASTVVLQSTGGRRHRPGRQQRHGPGRQRRHGQPDPRHGRRQRALSAANTLIATNGFTASGLALNLSLNFAPTNGQQITLIHDTGSAISGAFIGLAQGRSTTANFNGTTYYFLVSYTGGTGHDLVLTAVSPGHPSGAITNDTPLFVWLPLSGGVSEELAIGDLTTRQNPLLVVPLASGTGYQLATSQALTIGNAYIWYIGEVSSGGGIAWSAGIQFNVTALAAPTLIAPSGTIAPSSGYDTPTFTWSSVPDAVQYAIDVKDTSAGVTAVYTANFGGTSFTPSQPLLAGHNYVWSVGAEGTRADAGPVAWSSTANFSVEALAVPTAQSPNSPIAASTGYDTPTFSWSSASFAVNYNLYVEDAATGAVVIDNTTLTGTSFAPGPLLLAGHSYTWWIGAESAAGVLGKITWSAAGELLAGAAGRSEQPVNEHPRFNPHVELVQRHRGHILSAHCGGCGHGGDGAGQQQHHRRVVRGHRGPDLGPSLHLVCRGPGRRRRGRGRLLEQRGKLRRPVGMADEV